MCQLFAGCTATPKVPPFSLMVKLEMPDRYPVVFAAPSPMVCCWWCQVSVNVVRSVRSYAAVRLFVMNFWPKKSNCGVATLGLPSNVEVGLPVIGLIGVLITVVVNVVLLMVGGTEVEVTVVRLVMLATPGWCTFE